MVSNAIASPQVRRAPQSANLYDILDLILDKGIVVDAFVRVSLVGIELLTVDLRIVIASVDTYLRYAEAVEHLSTLRARTDNSVSIPDMLGKGKPGERLAQGVQRVRGAVTGRERSTEHDGEHEHEDSTMGTLAKGAGAAALAGAAAAGVHKLADAITGNGKDRGRSTKSRGSRSRNSRARAR